MNQKVELHLLDKVNHLSELQIVLEEAPKYSLNISGKLQENSAASEIFNAIPDEFDYSNKFVLGIYKGDQLIGVIDILRGFPNKETAMLGLLLLREDKQQQGLGKISFDKLLAFLNNFPEITKIRISVVATNVEVLSFWKKLGFAEIGLRRPYQNGNIVSESIVLELSQI